MKKYFFLALNSCEIDEDIQTEFMQFILGYEQSVCSGDASLLTLKQVKSNGLYLKMMNDLNEKL